MTPSGNPRAPSKSMMVEWVKAAWETLSLSPPDIIIHSFAACGITTAQPDMIHCIKEDIAPEARQVIQRGWQSISDADQQEEIHVPPSHNTNDVDEEDAGEETEVDETHEVELE